jgi:hypothetical protein
VKASRLSRRALLLQSLCFSENRDRLLHGDIAAAFFDAVIDQAAASVCDRRAERQSPQIDRSDVGASQRSWPRTSLLGIIPALPPTTA